MLVFAGFASGPSRRLVVIYSWGDDQIFESSCSSFVGRVFVLFFILSFFTGGELRAEEKNSRVAK